jgi:hypothetical protein
MKLKIFLISSIIASSIFLASCEKDNFAEPASILSGRIIYNNEPVGVRSNALELELWQHGYANFTKIPVFIKQDGTFSAVLFDGKYKLVRMNGAPWENNTDSIDVEVRGNTIVDVPVVPYFSLSNVSFQKNGSQVTATFTVNKVSSQRNLKKVYLFLGKTIITDNGYNIARISKDAASITLGEPTTLTVSVPSANSSRIIFARVGIETDGIGQLLYSASEQIELN